MEANRPFSQLDWLTTPEAVRAYIVHLETTIFQMQQQLGQLEKRTEKLEVQTKMNSQNSSKHLLPTAPLTRRIKKRKKANASAVDKKATKGINNKCWNLAM